MARKNIPSVDTYIKKLFTIALVVSLPLFMIAIATNTGGGVNFAASPAPLTGSIELASPEDQLSYGDKVSFITSHNGRLGPKDRIYVTVLCSQDEVIYQASADPQAQFPLVQQDGFAALGKYWNTIKPAECTANLMHRTGGNRNYTISALDSIDFNVNGIQ